MVYLQCCLVVTWLVPCEVPLQGNGETTELLSGGWGVVNLGLTVGGPLNLGLGGGGGHH